MPLSVSKDMASLNKHYKTMLVVNNSGGVYPLGKGFILTSILIFGNILLMAAMLYLCRGIGVASFFVHHYQNGSNFDSVT